MWTRARLQPHLLSLGAELPSLTEPGVAWGAGAFLTCQVAGEEAAGVGAAL